ncbi:MAG: hypothetical protein ACRDQA_24710, partial [Nocardioidaceae bacterium]
EMDTTRLHRRRREAWPVLGMTLLDAEVWGAPGSPASFSNTALAACQSAAQLGRCARRVATYRLMTYEHLWPLVDRGTRLWWRMWGRQVDLPGPQGWLDAPITGRGEVGDTWLEDAAAAVGGSLVEATHESGLIPDMSALDSETFSAGDVRPEVRDFYEHTSSWRMEVWTQWSSAFQPGGELISRWFGRRVQQLALPMRPLDVARGMDSRVVAVVGEDGRQVLAAWLRTSRSTGEYVYSGGYSTRMLPGSRQPSVHVAFPLESGNVQVFLRPIARPDGSLVLASPAGPFGAEGAYVVVQESGRTYAARVPIHETFHLYVDDEGVLRTDHELRLWRASAVRLHYKLERRS